MGPERRSPVRLAPLGAGRQSHARNHLAAAQYFEQHDIRGHFTALTQMLMIHQPSDALRFMHNEIGRLIEEQDQMRVAGHDEAKAEGACFFRVHAEFQNAEGTRKKTFSKLVLASDIGMRRRAEQEAAHVLHDVVWGAGQQNNAHAVMPADETLHEQHRTPRTSRVSPHKPTQPVMSASSPSAPSLSGYEMGVLMCTYAALGWKDQLEGLLNNGVDVNTGDYDKRTALHLAASEGHTDVVECLIKNGADVNVTDRMGFSPLVDACRHGHLRIQNMLREAGGQVLGMDVTVAVADEYPAHFKPRQVQVSAVEEAKGGGMEVARGRPVKSGETGALRRVPSEASPRSRARMLSPFRHPLGGSAAISLGVATEVMPTSTQHGGNDRRFTATPSHLAAPAAFRGHGPAFQGLHTKGGATGGPRRFQSVRRF